ncbi:hypothetical protein [Numidum massiliense]|uniref:hypothetical protein n=1 Tax=Numidum massiliense TaxID=1522315 RepID=UPI0006D550C6|nr:hypothetical protein [Numidum massiliense]
MYQKGMAIFDEQESILEQFGGTLQQVFVNDYQARVKRVRDKINHIEANPKSFYSLGGIKENQMRTSIWSSNSSLYGSTEIVKVSVNDSFSSLNMSDIGSVAPTIHNQIIAGRRFVRKMRKSIEDLFEADKKLSAIFEIG